MNVVFGFDPGGVGAFAWSVCELSSELPLRVLGSGIAPHAQAAVAAALAHNSQAEVVGAGIDSPLFWAPNGDRLADKRVRCALVQAGCPTAAGTVQHVNSLRGACLVQGVMAAHELRRARPSVVISESHPKAALWLLGVASKIRTCAAVTAVDIDDLHTEVLLATEHERDAALGALSAWAAVTRPTEWVDLLADEPAGYFPAGPASYYMPDPYGMLTQVPPRSRRRSPPRQEAGPLARLF